MTNTINDMKKVILAMASAVIMASCGSGPQLTREQIIEYGEIAYSDIVSYIVVGFQTNWDGMDPSEMKLSPVYSYSSPYAGFTRKDIDGDGFEELLIGDRFDDGSYALYDIYCFDPGSASLIHLASGGERDRFVVNMDGVIIESGSNSAEDSFVKGYRISEGKLVACDNWDDSLMDISLEYFSDLAQPQQLCGGYTPQREPVEEEMAMFAAATDNNPDYTPLSVSTQVVAGTNYRFWCRCRTQDGCGHCWIVIFKPLPGQGEPRVTEITQE